MSGFADIKLRGILKTAGRRTAEPVLAGRDSEKMTPLQRMSKVPDWEHYTPGRVVGVRDGVSNSGALDELRRSLGVGRLIEMEDYSPMNEMAMARWGLRGDLPTGPKPPSVLSGVNNPRTWPGYADRFDPGTDQMIFPFAKERSRAPEPAYREPKQMSLSLHPKGPEQLSLSFEPKATPVPAVATSPAAALVEELMHGPIQEAARPSASLLSRLLGHVRENPKAYGAGALAAAGLGGYGLYRALRNDEPEGEAP